MLYPLQYANVMPLCLLCRYGWDKNRHRNKRHQILFQWRLSLRRKSNNKN